MMLVYFMQLKYYEHFSIYIQEKLYTEIWNLKIC